MFRCKHVSYHPCSLQYSAPSIQYTSYSTKTKKKDIRHETAVILKNAMRKAREEAISMVAIDLERQEVERDAFNTQIALPYNLRMSDFENTMNDVYDFFFEINTYCVSKGWGRLEDIMQKQALSNFLSNMLNTSLASHSRELVVNELPNGNPDLIPRGLHRNNMVAHSSEGVEVKATFNSNGAVDMHGAREQDLCVFVYDVDTGIDKPLSERRPLAFSSIFLGHVTPNDYRRNERGELGTRTATLNKEGLRLFRKNWVYLTGETRKKRRWCKDL